MNNKIICKPLDSNYIKIAAEMAQENYDMERKAVNALASKDNREFYQDKLESLFEKGIGRIAFQNDEPVGFLAFSEIYDIGNGVKEATSPLYGYGIRSKDRGKVIGYLFQATATEICEKYGQSLRVNVYAHDREVLNMYIMSAFSMDTTDVVRNTANQIPLADKNNYTFAELVKSQLVEYKTDIIELYRNLINHLRVSPVFYPCNEFLPIEDRFQEFFSEDIRIFAAFHNNQLIGIIGTEPTDLEFIPTNSKDTGMGVVFIKPEYRGLGVGQALLDFANNKIKEWGIDRVFVTHVTINPTARGFWDKYFTNYSYTMTRQIDSQMLGIINRI